MASLAEEMEGLSFVGTDDRWRQEAERMGLDWGKVKKLSEESSQSISKSFLQQAAVKLNLSLKKK